MVIRSLFNNTNGTHIQHIKHMVNLGNEIIIIMANVQNRITIVI